MAEINPDPIIACSYYAAIGRIAANWGEFETDVDEAIMELAGVDFPFLGLCITAQFNSIIPRMNAVSTLIRERGANQEFLNEFGKLTGTTEALGGERNDTIHANWYFDAIEKRTMRRRIKAKKHLRTLHDPITVDALHDLAHRISEHRLDFIGFITRLRASLSPLHDIPPEPTEYPPAA